MRGETERGVSPVVGVVLVVAVVVVLAATVGAYALDFGDRQPLQPPRTAIVADYGDRTTGNGEYLNLTVESGETLHRENLSIAVTGARDADGDAVSLATGPVAAQAPTRVVSGFTLVLHAGHFGSVDGHLDLSDATVRLVWEPNVAAETNAYVVYRWPDPSRRN